MWQANWMSLGIIVTLLARMVQRMASSMRLTKNASAASCRHIMVLPWKCISVLPTAWAISQTSREKGSFLMRSSVLFWNCQISQRATVPGQYLLVFFTFPALRNSFQRALPPMVGQSFLLAGSSPKTDFWLGRGGAQERGTSYPSWQSSLFLPLFLVLFCPPSPSLGWVLFLPYYQKNKKETVTSWKNYYRI